MSKHTEMKHKLKITERGWAGHFCAASHCSFRRNTLIEFGDRRIVVSTVGNYNPPSSRKEIREDKQIGWNRYFETMAFEAQYIDPYWEANVSKQLDFESDWAIDKLERESDHEANDMHEKVVKELSKKIKVMK